MEITCNVRLQAKGVVMKLVQKFLRNLLMVFAFAIALIAGELSLIAVYGWFTIRILGLSGEHASIGFYLLMFGILALAITLRDR